MNNFVPIQSLIAFFASSNLLIKASVTSSFIWHRSTTTGYEPAIKDILLSDCCYFYPIVLSEYQALGILLVAVLMELQYLVACEENQVK
jgi:hypothetical protein